jgi:hypothetical protein
MDPNCLAADPYEPTAGARCPGLGLLRQDPLIGTPQWHPSKNWDPNRLAAAPYEPIVGTRRPGSGSLRQDPLIGAPQWHPLKNWEMGGASVLGGRHFVNKYNK